MALYTEALLDTEPGLSEIAFLLGYSELSAFDRAFRSWSGVSPGEYRRQQLRDHPRRAVRATLGPSPNGSPP